MEVKKGLKQYTDENGKKNWKCTSKPKPLEVDHLFIVTMVCLGLAFLLFSAA